MNAQNQWQSQNHLLKLNLQLLGLSYFVDICMSIPVHCSSTNQWIQIYNQNLGKAVWCPPSTVIGGVLAFNDQVGAEWFAPAGLTRGVLSGISNLGLVTSENEFYPMALNQGQRDVLYQDSINPLVNFPGQGLFIWGQKTLYPADTPTEQILYCKVV